MTFDEVLAQVRELLEREGRVSYRALKRRFSLDDDYLEDIKDELIKAKQLARDEAGAVLVWTALRQFQVPRFKFQAPVLLFHRLRTPNSELPGPQTLDSELCTPN